MSTTRVTPTNHLVSNLCPGSGPWLWRHSCDHGRAKRPPSSFVSPPRSLRDSCPQRAPSTQVSGLSLSSPRRGPTDATAHFLRPSPPPSPAARLEARLASGKPQTRREAGLRPRVHCAGVDGRKPVICIAFCSRS